MVIESAVLLGVAAIVGWYCHRLGRDDGYAAGYAAGHAVGMGVMFPPSKPDLSSRPPAPQGGGGPGVVIK